MNIKQITSQRYSTKAFDGTKKIPVEDFEQIKTAMRHSPSSVNIQPWHFVIADDEAGKARIAKATENFPFNTPKITEASHVVVFCAKLQADDDFLTTILEQEDKDGRYATAEFKKGGDDARKAFLGIHRNKIQDETQWLSKQVHINMGFTLMAAAALGIDSVPMEGVDFAALDSEFGLREKGYAAVAVVSFGYRAESDFNAKLPKSRLEENVIFSKA
ncbi:oxygen-insensitive NAD(P)H nitroreductase [Rodentibacter myodis]|uniref:NAD(P)H nitroreductase n=1 Tax=Rodentibacter myodis TaxID=1907939 RepID=A0A1V3JRV9_9PAST|nr:oxygen-insensitive NAD(P)H nitroreductase [Rodentibacter myodis]OOF59522.1 NAD(P)H nitroreductase [Rodentibacter myodis]